MMSLKNNCKKDNAVEPLVATNSLKQPALLGDHFSKIPKVSHSNHYIRNLLWETNSPKQPWLNV